MKNETLKQNKHLLLLLIYIPLRILYFGTQFLNLDYTVVHLSIDDKIPFVPQFVVAYVVWYVFVPLLMIYTGIHNKETFYKQCMAIFSGIVISLIIFIVYPTMVDFRPAAEGDGVMLWICRFLFANDNPVNVCPSMHCFEAACIVFVTFINRQMRQKKLLFAVSAVTALLICLSTMFIKQHSVLDAALGIALAFIMAVSVYMPDVVKKHKTVKIKQAENA